MQGIERMPVRMGSKEVARLILALVLLILLTGLWVCLWVPPPAF